MTNTKVNTLPQCIICGKPAEYDSPINGGPWGFLCPDCFKKHGNLMIATKLELRVKSKATPMEGVKRVDVTTSDWDQFFITCPTCEEEREVEPDAHYSIECEGCGQKLKLINNYC